MDTKEESGVVGGTGRLVDIYILLSFPEGANGKETACQCRRHKKHGSNP